MKSNIILICSSGITTASTPRRPVRRAGQSVRLRTGGIQRRTARPARGAGGRAAVPHRWRTVGSANRGQGHTGAGLAWRGVRRGAAAGAGGPERRVPKLLRLGHRPAQGAEDQTASVPIPQGPQAGDPVHPQCSVLGHAGRQVAAAQDRERTSALVTAATVPAVIGHRDQGLSRSVLRSLSSSRPSRAQFPRPNRRSASISGSSTLRCSPTVARSALLVSCAARRGSSGGRSGHCPASRKAAGTGRGPGSR